MNTFISTNQQYIHTYKYVCTFPFLIEKVSDSGASSLANGTSLNGHAHPEDSTNQTISNTAGDSSIADTAAAAKDEGFFVGSTQSLFVFIMNNKVALYNAFLDVDVLEEGLVSVNDWVMVRQSPLHVCSLYADRYMFYTYVCMYYLEYAFLLFNLL